MYLSIINIRSLKLMLFLKFTHNYRFNFVVKASLDAVRDFKIKKLYKINHLNITKY